MMRRLLPWLIVGWTLFGQVTDPDDDSLAQLAKVRRVYVDVLVGGPTAVKLRDLLITSLQASKLFVLTENPDKADATLKGAGEDNAFMESFQSSDGVTAKTQLSLPGSGSDSSRYSDRTSTGLSVGENESRRTEERKHEAIATVRLVAKDGDVLWSTTQESPGGKFMGAAADVADKVAKRLSADVRRARSTVSPAQVHPAAAAPTLKPDK